MHRSGHEVPASASHSIQLVWSLSESASQRFLLDRQRAAFATYEMPDEVRFGWAALQVKAVAATYWSVPHLGTLLSSDQ